ncbi:hypothetical protein [Anaerococcus ihuae]|nr:hypothetical protein [Anaerococcus ihuae]
MKNVKMIFFDVVNGLKICQWQNFNIYPAELNALKILQNNYL